MYYAWLKKHNHLYKDTKLDESLLDGFLNDSITASKEFEGNTRKVDQEEETDESENEDEDTEANIVLKHFRNYNPEPDHKNDDWSNDQTTMFLNKYCENIDLPSVANRVADTIVDFEIMQSIPFQTKDDFDIDDEIITEEEFLNDVDAELDELESSQSDSDYQIEESLEDILSTHKTVNDEISDHVETVFDHTNSKTKDLANKARKEVKSIGKKMEKICVAPGEDGKFQNWKEDVFLEEKAFPGKFPYGTGGYLSSQVNDSKNDMGFANYCINQIMSCDPKFRQDSAYLFFLHLVKELIQLKRCKSTYFRQATRLPNLSKEDVMNVDHENLSIFNRSYQVFKNVRGTSMYYAESKKNLMALLRQNGCPSIFLTLSCAEFDWPELLREIMETVYRKKVTKEDIEKLTKSEKNKLISENVVQSTLHFQKRVDKMFSLMQKDFFEGASETYHVSSYFYRIEFQQRGAPHVHSLLWLKNKKNEDAPNFWFETEDKKRDQNEMTEDQQKRYDEKKKLEYANRIKQIEEFADCLISTSSKDISCDEHEDLNNDDDSKLNCEQCQNLIGIVDKYQSHNHTFTCEKKKRTITIKESEGHGRQDGNIKGPQLYNVSICRFRFPKFPMDETKLILGMSKDLDETVINTRKADLNRIIKYLVRQTYSERNHSECEGWKHLKDLTFWEFLYEVGMFEGNKVLNDYRNEEKEIAKTRYLNAISASVQGNAATI